MGCARVCLAVPGRALAVPGLRLGCAWAAPGLCLAVPGCAWAAPVLFLAVPGLRLLGLLCCALSLCLAIGLRMHFRAWLWSPGVVWCAQLCLAVPGQRLGCARVCLAVPGLCLGCAWTLPGCAWLCLAVPGLRLAAPGCARLMLSDPWLGCPWLGCA